MVVVTDSIDRRQAGPIIKASEAVRGEVFRTNLSLYLVESADTPMAPRCTVTGSQQRFRSWPKKPYGSPPTSPPRSPPR